MDISVCDNQPSNTSNSTSRIPIASELLTSYTIIITIASFVGILSNPLAILAIGVFRNLRNANNVIVVNMCVASWLFCIVVIPVVVATVIYGDWMWSDTWCTITGGLAHFLGGIIACMHGTIAVNRLVHIIYPAYYHKIYSKTALSLLLISFWLACFLVCLLCPLTDIWGEYSYDALLYSCTFDYSETTSHMFFILSIGFFIPTGVISTCYIIIFFYVRHSQKKLNNWQHGELLSKHSTAIITAMRRKKYSNKISSEIVLQEDSDSVMEPSTLTRGVAKPSRNRTMIKTKMSKIHEDIADVSCITTISEYAAGNISPIAENAFSAFIPALEIALVTVFTGIDRSGSNQLLSLVGLTDRISSSQVVENNMRKKNAGNNQSSQNAHGNIDRHDGLDSDVKTGGEQNDDQSSNKLEINTNVDNSMHSSNRTQVQNLTGTNNRNISDEDLSPNTSTRGSGSNAWTVQKQEEKTKHHQMIATNKRMWESVRLTIMMSCAFVICGVLTVPYFMIHLFRNSPYFPTAYIVSVMLVGVSMCLNPILFGLMNVHYRKAYKILLIRCFKGCIDIQNKN